MKNNLAFMFLISAMTVSSVGSQTKLWDDSFISSHSIAVINVNVSRLSESYSKSQSLERLSAHCNKRHSLDLSTVDHFQVVLSSDPKLKFGPDSTANTKLVFKKPTEIDASIAGKLTGYGLAKGTYDRQVVYVGKYDGSWGAMRKNDRSVVMGVPRMLRSIIESQGSALNPAHHIAKLEKVNVDLCVTVSGGESAAKFAKSLLGSNEFIKTLNSFSSAIIYVDTRSEIAIRAEFKSHSPDETKVLFKELSELIDSGKKQLGEIQKFMNVHLEKMTEQSEPEYIQKSTRQQLATVEYFKSLVSSFKLSTNGNEVVLTSPDKQIVGELPTMLVDLFLAQ